MIALHLDAADRIESVHGLVEQHERGSLISA